MTSPAIIAFDVGGANIKSVTSQGVANSILFPMWKQHERLASTLSEMLSKATIDTAVVATMTGELADCFSSKEQGVAFISSALETAAADRSLQIYLTDGRFVTPDIARQEYQLAAASNWHALASFVATHDAWHNSILLDIGSTTCDVIPIANGHVVAAGTTDTQRLLAGELVYMGIERTPISSLTSELPYRGKTCPIARELFATTLDIQLVLGRCETQPQDCDTADGRPATREHAIVRLGRCVCADVDEWGANDAVTAARYLAARMAELLQQSLERVFHEQPQLRGAPIVVSGHGDVLFEPLLGNQIKREQLESLRDRIGADASRSAPAYALCRLAERARKR